MSTHENALLAILLDQIKNDKLVLPTLPEIALRVKEAVDHPEASLHSIAEVISKDPALTARMIKIANSAYYARAVKASNVTQAVNRIGLAAIKNIAISMAMEQLFICQNDVVFDYFDRTWNQSVAVASAATALLTSYRQRLPNSPIEADTLTLMGLIHNIGVLPILAEAEKHDGTFANATFLDGAISKLSKHIGVAIIRTWEFDKDYAVVVAKWDQFDYLPEAVSYLDFIRLGALHAGLLEAQRDQLLERAVAKRLIGSLDEFSSEPFLERFEQIRDSFGG